MDRLLVTLFCFLLGMVVMGMFAGQLDSLAHSGSLFEILCSLVICVTLLLFGAVIFFAGFVDLFRRSP